MLRVLVNFITYVDYIVVTIVILNTTSLVRIQTIRNLALVQLGHSVCTQQKLPVIITIYTQITRLLQLQSYSLQLRVQSLKATTSCHAGRDILVF